jgi:hypothetical protein
VVIRVDLHAGVSRRIACGMIDGVPFRPGRIAAEFRIQKAGPR